MNKYSRKDYTLPRERKDQGFYTRGTPRTTSGYVDAINCSVELVVNNGPPIWRNGQRTYREQRRSTDGKHLRIFSQTDEAARRPSASEGGGSQFGTHIVETPASIAEESVRAALGMRERGAGVSR